MQTSISGCIIAICFEIIIFTGLLFQNDQKRQSFSQKKAIVAHFAIILLGIIVFFLTILPPPDFSFGGDWNFSIDAKRGIKTLAMTWKVFFPFPEISINFWNTNILDSFFVGRLVGVILSLLILGFIVFLFLRRPTLLFFYLSATLGILAFAYFRYVGFFRHFGHLFILFIVTFWLKDFFIPINIRSGKLRKISTWCEAKSNIFLLFILVVQFAAGTFSVAMDWKLPFSASKKTSEFIMNEKLDNLIILGSKDYAISPIAAYLNRKIYYPTSESFGAFVRWTTKRKHKSCEEIVQYTEQLLKIFEQTDVLIILNYDCQFEGENIKKIAEFKKSIVSDEVYFLFLASAHCTFRRPLDCPNKKVHLNHPLFSSPE